MSLASSGLAGGSFGAILSRPEALLSGLKLSWAIVGLSSAVLERSEAILALLVACFGRLGGHLLYRRGPSRAPGTSGRRRASGRGGGARSDSLRVSWGIVGRAPK